MKKKICILLLVVFSFVLLSAFKGGSGFSVEVDDSFAVATKSSEVEEVAQRLSLETEEVFSYFEQNALKFIAISEDGKTQIRISRFADSFSGDIYDSENLTPENIAEMVSLYGADTGKVDIVENGGRKFAKITEILEDSGGQYTSTQYVTVASGRTFVISCYNPGKTTSEEVEKIFGTFTVKSIDEHIKSYSVGKKLVLPAIIIACIFVAVTVIGLIKNLYQKENLD